MLGEQDREIGTDFIRKTLFVLFRYALIPPAETTLLEIAEDKAEHDKEWAQHLQGKRYAPTRGTGIVHRSRESS